MNDVPVDPLPPDIAALLALEKSAYPEDAAMKAAVLAHTEMVVGLGGGPGPGGGASGGGAPKDPPLPASPPRAPLGAAATGIPKLVAVGLAAFLGGGVVGGLVMKPSSPPPLVAAPVLVAPSATSAVAPLPDPIAAPPPSPSASASLAASSTPTIEPTASASAPVSTARGDLVREREILDAAHAALAHGRAADALAAVQRHATQWPRGYLGEEREVVRIQALVASGRRGEAEQLATRFRATHPKSMLLPAVDAAVPP